MDNLRRRKVMNVTTSIMADLFHGGLPRTFDVISDAIPKDTKIIDVKFNGFNDVITFLLESDQFDEVPLGEKIPEITPVLRAHYYELTPKGE